MKKYYYFILFCVFSGGLSAQRETDLGITFNSPANNSVFAPMEVFYLNFTISNNGPDNVLAEDTLEVHLYLDGQAITFQPGDLEYIAFSAAIASGNEQVFTRPFSFSSGFDGSTVEICLETGIRNQQNPVTDPVSANDMSCTSVIISSQASLEDKAKLFEVFPNPASAYLKLKSDIHPDAVSIKDATGRAYDAELSAEGSISLEGFTAGMYFLQIETTDGIIVKQFMIQ